MAEEIGVDSDFAGFIAQALVEMMNRSAYLLAGSVRLPIVGKKRPARVTPASVESALMSDRGLREIRKEVKEELDVKVDADALKRALSSIFSVARAEKYVARWAARRAKEKAAAAKKKTPAAKKATAAKKKAPMAKKSPAAKRAPAAKKKTRR
jgi:hypothetical protein